MALNTKRVKEILEEMYHIDPSLVAHEAVLVTLITEFKERRPDVTINQSFVTELRTALLSYKPATTQVSPLPANKLLWLATRLVPVGVVACLVVIIGIPQYLYGPTTNNLPEEESPAGATLEYTADSNTNYDQSVPDSVDFFSAERAITPINEPGVAPLLVVPPLAFNTTITITEVTMPLPGWLVVYEDVGGSYGNLLGVTRVSNTTYKNLTVNLSRPLTYPKLVTVAVYTRNNSTGFDIFRESLQVDQATNLPLIVTVPVITTTIPPANQ